jgi:hypothetical protein
LGGGGLGACRGGEEEEEGEGEGADLHGEMIADWGSAYRLTGWPPKGGTPNELLGG